MISVKKTQGILLEEACASADVIDGKFSTVCW